MDAPETTFVRRKTIFEWLGITKHDLAKVVAAGLIHPVILPGGTYRKYLTKEVQRVFKKGVKYEEAVDMAKTGNPSSPKRLRRTGK